MSPVTVHDIQTTWRNKKRGFLIQKKVTKKQKYFHLIGAPILIYIGVYLTIHLLNLFFTLEVQMSIGMESIGHALGISIVYWFTVFYPSKPKSTSTEPNKSVKEYIKQYVIKGTSFHKTLILIYSFCAIILIIVWLTGITG